MTERAYGSPDAFRRALTDRLRAVGQESRWDLAQLQRQMAYDRLLERLYFVDDGWIVKGAAALLAREIGVRASIDIDVYRAKALEIAEAELREAAVRDIGDWFRFEVGPSQPAGDGSPAVRLPVIAYVGQAEWARFHVDLVGSDIVMTGTPDDVPPSDQHPSTRYRDLVDLVSILGGATVDAQAQTIALRSEEQRRQITLPDRFDVPDRASWETGYAREAERSLLPYAKTLDEALAAVRPFVDPLLDGSAHGSWDHASARWSTG